MKDWNAASQVATSHIHQDIENTLGSKETVESFKIEL
jgi:hypothetical protein